MPNIEEIKQLILAHEEKFANGLGLKVIEKPRLSVWMILVPIIFVYFFYRYQKFNTGRKEFAEHYMKGIRRALDAAVTVVETGEPADPKALAEMPDIPEQIREHQAGVFSVLLEHYTDLLKTEGEDMESLLRFSYKTRTNYLLFINQLSQAEKKRNQALIPVLSDTMEDVNQIIDTIERNSEMLRREIAEQAFPNAR